MSEKIEVVRKMMPATIMIPGDKVNEFVSMLEMARYRFAEEWDKETREPDPAKRATGIKAALDMANEVLEALIHSERG